MPPGAAEGESITAPREGVGGAVEDGVVEEETEGDGVEVVRRTVEVGTAGVMVGYIEMELEGDGVEVDVGVTPALLLGAPGLTVPSPPTPALPVGAGPEGEGERDGKSGVGVDPASPEEGVGGEDSVERPDGEGSEVREGEGEEVGKRGEEEGVEVGANADGEGNTLTVTVPVGDTVVERVGVAPALPVGTSVLETDKEGEGVEETLPPLPPPLEKLTRDENEGEGVEEEEAEGH